jgi:type IV pilus assembly protein PilX
MMRMHRYPDQTQSGAALVIALLMLIVLLMLGIAAVHIGLQSEKMSRNRRDRQVAWQAAEAALLDAEYDIGNPNSPRYALFGKLAWNESTSGTREASATPGEIYGSHSGHIMQTGVGALPLQPARYLIEILPPAAAQASTDLSQRYRVSALGFGPDPLTRVMLQSIYRRQSSATAATSTHSTNRQALSSMRLSWREIAARDFR